MTLAALVAAAAGIALAETRTLVATPAPVALDAAPLSVILPEGASEALMQARRGGATIALSIRGIEGHVAQAVRIDVFAGKPDAANTTPTTDPHYIGTITLLPRPGGVVSKSGAIFDLTNAPAAAPGQPLTVTLVPVVGTGRDKPRDVALTIGRLSLEEIKER
jgi:hypothetical protein